jgi:predicted acetyltransferase
MAIMLSGQGIGRELIKTIFKDNPSIKHIMLYTTDSALGFWKKVGGEVLGEKDGKYYMKINKH